MVTPPSSTASAPRRSPRAVDVAWRVPVGDLDEAKKYADRFTWANFASGVRSLLAEAAGRRARTYERTA